MSAYDDIMMQLHGRNIWDGFSPMAYKIHGYSDFSIEFGRLIDELSPSVIVEIGSWYGLSAMSMASHVKKSGIKDCVIVCIDTWLGSIEHWHENNRSQLLIQNGYPHVYHQFLSNVKHAGHDDVILPMPMSSLAGLRWLGKYKVVPQLVYIDGSHDEWDVYADLKHADRILGLGGVLCGDDYNWLSVHCAVDEFAKETNRAVQTSDDHGIFWMMR